MAVAPIPIPLGTPRKNEVVALSFFYKQNLLNSFLYLAQSKKCQDPICECGIDEQTAFHITAACKLVDKELQMECKRAITRCNGVDVVIEDYISLLNSSRDKLFIDNLLKIVENNSPRLRKKYIIVKNY